MNVLRLLKIAGYVSLISLFVLLGLAAFTQTGFFRERVRILLSSALSERLNGTFSMGTLGGNFVTGFTIDSLVIDYQDRPFLRTGKITCKYDPLLFLEKKIGIRYFIVEQPRIFLRRSAGGDWNFAKLLKPDSGGGGAFDWSVSGDDVELKNGIVSIVDSTSPGLAAGGPHRFFDAAGITVKDINLQFVASAAGNDYRVRILHTSWYSDNPQFELTHGKGDFIVDERDIIASNVVLQSSRSYLELDASLRGPNLLKNFSLATLEHDSTRVLLKARNVDFAELSLFIPPMAMFEGSAFIDLAADGEFADLTLKRLTVGTRKSTISFSGGVRNLHHPENLSLAVFVNADNLNPPDISRLMPRSGIPGFDSTGRASVFGEFNGSPLNFRARAAVRGSFGELNAAGTLDSRGSRPVYDLTWSTKKLNLAHVIPDRRLRTSLTCGGRLKGAGLSLDSLTASLQMDIDSSRIGTLPIDSAHLALEGTPRRLTASTSVWSNPMQAFINAKGNFTDTLHPQYSTDISLNAVDLGRILSDEEEKSNLSVRGSIAASGRTIDDLNADLRLTFLPSSYRSHAIGDERVRFVLDQHDPNRKQLILESSAADARVEGRFDLDLAVAALTRQATNLYAAIREHALPEESTATRKPAPLAIRSHTAAERTMNFTYSISMKNLELLSSLLEGERFNGRGTLQGAISGTDDLMSVTCKGDLDELYVGAVDKGFILNRIGIDLSADSLAVNRTLEQLSASMNLAVRSGLVNGLRLDTMKVRLDYRRPRGTFSIGGAIDSAWSVTMSGQTSVQPHTYVFDLDDLRLSSGGITWKNDQDIQVRLNSEGTRVLHADMKRSNAFCSLTGFLHHDGKFDFSGSLANMDLAELGAWLRNPELSRPGQGFRGSLNADFHMSGSTTAPVISFQASSDSVYFRRSKIGSLAATISYDSLRARIEIGVKSDRTETAPKLVVSGTVPVNLGLSGVGQRFPDEEQNLRITSQGFDLSVLDPLIGELDDLTGKLACDVRLAGTPRSPQYSGSITLNDVGFIFTPNNIGYTVSADLQASGDKLLLKKFVVRNRPQEGLNGEAHFAGSLTIKDFTVSSFELTASGQLLLMTDATRKVQPDLYGVLFAEIDPNGMTMTGTPRRPYLSGKLSIRDANLTFPPPKERAGAESPLALNYIVVDDTSREDAGQPPLSKFYGRADTSAGTRSAEGRAGVSARPREPLFIEQLRYNLVIETRGTAAVKMIFTPATNEELYAELDGHVTAVNDEGTPKIYGEVEISPRSYYNFFKKFDATGKLKFVGQWDNPEMDIQAKYEGYRTDVVSDSTQEQKVVVELNISGTRYNPKLDMGLKVQLHPDEDLTDWSTQARGGDVQSDAISFIITGKFRDQLTSRDQQQIGASVGSATGTSVASTFISGLLTDALKREFPFIRSADVSYQGSGSFQQGANVNVSATAFKGYVRVGGRILNDIGDASVSYQVSLGDVFNSTTIRNLFLEIQRRVEGDNPVNPEDRKLTNEARLYYRFSF